MLRPSPRRALLGRPVPPPAHASRSPNKTRPRARAHHAAPLPLCAGAVRPRSALASLVEAGGALLSTNGHPVPFRHLAVR